MVFDVILGRNESDLRKFGKDGTVFIGRAFVKMGRTTSLSNNIYLDITKGHVVYIVGKRGSGKCLHGDSLVTLGNGMQIQIKDLEEIPENIFSLDNRLKISEKEKTGFYKRKVPKLLEIELRSGKKIKLTPEHPLLTLLRWIPAEELNLGDKIATPRKIEAFGSNSLKECDVKLLAYLIAEGHLGNKIILFTNADQRIISDFEIAVEEFNSNLMVSRHSKYSYRVSQIKPRYINVGDPKRDKLGRFTERTIHLIKSPLKLWLEQLNLYGTRSLTKFIPNEIFSASKRQLSLFLNRLFSCDGTIYKVNNHWFVGYASSSYQLITQVQHLLLRFGILSKLRTKTIQKKFKSYELVISGNNIITYLDEIGF